MMGHQREILASLGIDIWVSRTAVSQTLPQPSVWRDQAAPEIYSDIIVPAAVNQQLKQQQPIIQEEPKQEPSPQHTVVEVVVPDDIPEARVMLQVEAFSIEALQLPYCVILVESTALSQKQQQLWRNIQHALQAEYHVLQWPFAIEVLQDGIGVENYVQGFVDVLSADKKMLILGQLPHFKSEQCLHLASLQEMLDQPLLKKSLWDAIQATSLQLKA
nr:hypothetical protein [uncultured Acinetobacter sp.]